MKAHTYVTAASLLALAAAATCGGGSSKPVTPGDFCNQKATAECQVASQCGSTLTMSNCVAERTTVCTQFGSAIQAPRVFTPGNVGNCINNVKSVFAKTTAILATDLAKVDDVCNYVYQGNVAAQGACTTKYDCAGKTDGSIICDKGVCATKSVKGNGAGCSDPGAVCSTGQFCQKSASTTFYTCVPKGDRGATCDDATPCLESLRCVAGACTDRVAAGGACITSDDCMTGSTAPYCDVFNGSTCDSGLQFAPGSASCMGFTSSGVTAGTTPPTGGGAGGAGGSDGGTGGTGGAVAGGGG